MQNMPTSVAHVGMSNVSYPDFNMDNKRKLYKARNPTATVCTLVLSINDTFS